MVEVSQQVFDGTDGGVGQSAFVDVGVGEGFIGMSCKGGPPEGN